MTVSRQPTPTIGLSHVGFMPNGRKRVVVRDSGVKPAPTYFELFDIGSTAPFYQGFGLYPVSCDLGSFFSGDFSQITRPGLYQISVGNEISPPFFIRADAWRRHLPLFVGYHKAQRCGCAVPNVHAVCHMDDSLRRDNQQHLNTTGGWHDAGDVRKWMESTMLNAFGLHAIARNLGAGWDAAGSGFAPLNEELRWGNTYFLKMQDTDGCVFNDVGAGVNGDNSDNHWTDNVFITADDRHLNPAKPPLAQAMFTALQALYAQRFAADTAYSALCLNAAVQCWQAADQKLTTDTVVLSYWLLAAVELHRATQQDTYASAGNQLAAQLLQFQQPGSYWIMGSHWNEPYKEAAHSAMPPFALLEAARYWPQSAGPWKAAVLNYLRNYVDPMSGRSPYGIMPFGLYQTPLSSDLYRPYASGLSYRFFMPSRQQFWWQGLNAHLACHALLLATAARDFGDSHWRDLAYAQLEWIFGNNPFAATMATGLGARTPYPFSRFVDQIPGGIMNGICGNANDEPTLDTTYTANWRSNEYWSAHVGYFEWAQSVLEMS